MTAPLKQDIQKMSEGVSELDKQVRVTRVEVDGLRQSLARHEDLSQRTEDKQDQTVEKVRDQVVVLQSQVAVLAASLSDLKKRWDESDLRRWSLYGMFLGAALTFAANLILLLLRR